jgi:hypothetical protein
MITPYDVGQMTDEELAHKLNERWTAIILLLHKAGGSVTFTRQELAEFPLDVGLETSHDLVNGTMTVRILEKTKS